MDTANVQFVGAAGPDAVTVMMPKIHMSADEALMHAAWLVAIAEHSASFSFAEALAAVRSS